MLLRNCSIWIGLHGILCLKKYPDYILFVVCLSREDLCVNMIHMCFDGALSRAVESIYTPGVQEKIEFQLLQINSLEGLG